MFLFILQHHENYKKGNQASKHEQIKRLVEKYVLMYDV